VVEAEAEPLAQEDILAAQASVTPDQLVLLVIQAVPALQVAKDILVVQVLVTLVVQVQ
jgi:hypothetical protein